MTFEPYLRLWNLVPDGKSITTHSSDLLPVRWDGAPAMVKVARTTEEERGNLLMIHWDGRGAAAVLAHEGPGILLERAEGGRSLVQMATTGHDRQATKILCRVATALHRRQNPAPDLLPCLREWFTELRSIAKARGGWLLDAAALAEGLLATQSDFATLHGDLHHGNVLDFGGDWRAIDPKGLYGERTFEFANLLRNPDARTAMTPGRLATQATVIAGAAGVDRQRLLRWTYALCGLSAAWLIGDGAEPELDQAVAAIVARELQAP